MKKFLVLLLGVLCFNIAYSQNKHQKPEDFIAVKAGDIGLGFSTTYNRSDIPFQSGLFAKLFVADSWALRFNLRFGRDFAKGIDPAFITGSENDIYYDTPDYDYPDYDYPDYGDNTANGLTTIRKSNFMLVVGVEHRHKLSNRFIGYYGTDFGAGGYGQVERQVNPDLYSNNKSFVKQNRSADVTIQPFIGMEYFLGSRISVAIEGGYDILFKFYSKDIIKDSYAEYKNDQYNKIASHIDFGNSVFGTAKLTYYF